MSFELENAIEELRTGETQAPATDDSQPNMDVIMGIPVDVQIAIGRVTMPVAQVMKLARGSVITLDRRLDEPVEVVVNGRIIARGEVVVLKDDPSRFGISLTEIIDK